MRDRLINGCAIYIVHSNLYRCLKYVEIEGICLYCSEWVIDSAAHSREHNQTIRLYRVIEDYEGYRVIEGLIGLYRIKRVMRIAEDYRKLWKWLRYANSHHLIKIFVTLHLIRMNHHR